MLYSIITLALGLAAWGVALTALFLRRKKGLAQLCGMGSLTCCAASLCMVVFALAHYADVRDVSAFLDTANAFRLCSGALLLGTLALNAIALIFRPRSGDSAVDGGAILYKEEAVVDIPDGIEAEYH